MEQIAIYINDCEIISSGAIDTMQLTIVIINKLKLIKYLLYLLLYSIFLLYLYFSN